MKLCTLALILLATTVTRAQAPISTIAPTLAKTPPMGWNSWNKFHNRVDDAGVRAMADAIDRKSVV